MESILISIKKLLGIDESYDHFDPDLIMHINSVFSILTQMGVGPTDGFYIKAMQEKLNNKTEAQRLRETEKLCFSALLGYMKLLQEWKRLYAPRTPEEKWHPHFVEVCEHLDYVEYLADLLIMGDSYERNEVIDRMLTDGKLEKLQNHLKKHGKGWSYEGDEHGTALLV